MADVLSFKLSAGRTLDSGFWLHEGVEERFRPKL